MKIVDAVVVGLGAMGSAAAYQLAKKRDSSISIARLWPTRNDART